MTETNTPTSTGNESLTLAERIKKYKTKELINFLCEEQDLDIIREQRVNGLDFLKVTEKKLRSYGMRGGPATRLANFAKECKEKKVEIVLLDKYVL
jgi:hypothetical protein